MLPKTHHSGLSMLLVLAVGIVTALTGLTASGCDSSSTPMPSSGTSKDEVVQNDQAAALTIAQEYGLIDAIAGDQPWSASEVKRTEITGSSNAVVFIASWDKPVETSGPWRDIKCQGTRVYELSMGWTNVHMIRVTVDLDQRQVLGTIVKFPGLADPSYGDPVPSGSDSDTLAKGYDLETNQVFYDGTLGNVSADVLRCPPGKSDD